MRQVRNWTSVAAAVALVALPGTLRADDKAMQDKSKEHDVHMSTVADSPEWQRLKTLVGQWDAVVEENGAKHTTHVEVRMTGDGSALMHWLDKDTPHEMVTMFHPDGKRLMATHYCSAHNQPRMVLMPSAQPNQERFEFVDGTNITPGSGHMQGVTLTFIDADHHDESWSFATDGKVAGSMTMHFTRSGKR